MTDSKKNDFRKRTKTFAASVIRLYCSLPKARPEIQILGQQLLRSGTSVAANYREGSRARSSAEFISKVETCAQEADESQLWLELLEEECGVPGEKTTPIWKEADELIAILVTMARNAKR